MKKALAMILAAILIAAVLVACGDNNEDVDTGGNTTPDNENNINENDGNVINNENNNNENEIEENNNLNDENNDGNEGNESAVESEDFDDQMDLSIGDTAQISSNTGVFEITLDDASVMEEYEGEPSALEVIVLLDVTLENTGEDTFDADDTVNSLELSESEETGGTSQVYLDGLDTIEGDLAPGESISGQMLYDAEESDTYYLKITGGLIASGAVHNEVMWTFESSEAE